MHVTMPCRHRIITFGWSPHFVYRHVVNIPLNLENINSENITLITAKPLDNHSRERFEAALEEVRRFLRSLGYMKELDVIMVEHTSSPVDTLITLLEKVLLHRCEEVIVDVSGGLRLHDIVAAMLAIQLSKIVKVRLFVGLETISRLYEVPLEIVEATIRMGRTDVEVLSKLLTREMSVTDLAAELNKDESYIRKIVKKLERAGLVTKASTARVVKYRATKLGEVAVKIEELKHSVRPGKT